MSAEAKLRELGFELPAAPEPVGAYVPAVRVGNLVFTSGQLPTKDGKLIAEGKVPEDVAVEAAQFAARQGCLNALAAVAAEAGGLDAITRIVRLNVFVNSTRGFTDQAKVANGASEMLEIVFKRGHTRCAVGVAELPMDAPVELDMIVECKPHTEQ